MNENFCKIRDVKTGQYVDLISTNGYVINSNNGTIWSNYSDALSYLYNIQRSAFSSSIYIDLDRFIVETYKTYVSSTDVVPDTITHQIMDNPDKAEHIMMVRTLLLRSVMDGFNVFKKPLFDFCLSYDKYQSMIKEIVPPHMLQCCNDFMCTGILTCNIDDLGAIYLTASKEQIIMHDIDGVIRNRNNEG